jgi:hypothetical protein
MFSRAAKFSAGMERDKSPRPRSFPSIIPEHGQKPRNSKDNAFFQPDYLSAGPCNDHNLQSQDRMKINEEIGPITDYFIL